ncbi:16S rRNA (guanine527-N7)-methyltransferase [Rheinheimera pacifica]|uniref:16S rRNA (guanine(527)-N(7))-methyltransferase RsmG n=1 Tax=Rheinheimera pacifica TaxID=173990 RepID=UPI000CA80084|nr:16S rRNA (guanine(527)-N(7))-methyltransferase RsmG [Rheinheimera pacifica]MDR6985366.1 16S rRNA (guanine527-N7)-methyltransferase [Rheinheimera pacifica]PKM18169.1 MAG: 16S rRNA (guanine(527)-N(7))-methyltransferase RsmG [Gammaproteobacteria bacterium HGW-Gammaproteobacteria-15]
MLDKLKALVAQTSLTLSEQQLQQCIAYVQLLDKWNSAYNLTSVRNPEEMLIKHVMDSLVVAPFLTGQRFIDVGTGPGLPGVLLAIYYPDKHFTLLDSLGKRIRFLNQVKLQLKLANIQPLQSRVEDHQPEQGYDGVISRAFASINDMLSWCRHLPATNGCFFAMKGAAVQEEIAALPDFVKVTSVQPLVVPQLQAQRHLVILDPN